VLLGAIKSLRDNMKYILRALFEGWFSIIRYDAVHGNGFQITAYGMMLIGKYCMFYFLRVIMFVFFPLTAFLLYLAEKKEGEKTRSI
jgi:hypothetical protein